MNPRRPLLLRGLIIVGGLLLLLIGALLLVLPGPGLVLIVGALGILALEFRWAAALRDSAIRRTERVRPKRRSHQIVGTILLVAAGIAATIAVSIWGLPI